jgi:uncharacterized membrane protein YkoI
MLKKVLTATGIAAALSGMFLLGSFALGPTFAQTQQSSSAVPTVTQGQNDDYGEENIIGQDTDNIEEQMGEQNDQEPQYTSSITVDESQYKDMSETEEAVALQSRATITSTQAEAAALTANPGTTATDTELDNEDGFLVYSVELDNGIEVKVDPGNGKVLHTEQAGGNATEVAGQEAAED